MVWNINQHNSDHFCLICIFRRENFVSICNWTCNHLVSISSQYHLIIYKTTFSICHMSMIINFIKTHAIGTLFCFVLGHPCTFHICCVRAVLAVTGETRNTWVRVVFSLRCKLSPVIRALIRNTAKSDTSNTCSVGKSERFRWTIYLMCNVFPFSQRKVLSLSLHWITTLPPWKLESANSACTRD